MCYNYTNNKDKAGECMQAFETDRNQVEIIEGMTIEYPYCLHKRDLTNLVIPWHWHEELELGYIQEGISKIVTIGAEYTVRQGDGFFVNSNVHEAKCLFGRENDRNKPYFSSGLFRRAF